MSCGRWRQRAWSNLSAFPNDPDFNSDFRPPLRINLTSFQAPRGTTDLLPEEQKYWRYIESKAVTLAQRYGFWRIDSPTFEDANLFVRSVGEGTDLVEKEMYTFGTGAGTS